MIEHNHTAVTVTKQCELLDIPRSTVYYKPMASESNNIIVMNEIREIYQRRPYYGYRRITVELRRQGLIVNHKRTQRLMVLTGIKAIYPSKKTSIKNKQHKIYPYLLKGLKIERPNQVWQVDITYIKLSTGFVYLFCLIDVFSRRVMGYSMSVFLEAEPCIEALDEALKEAIPEIINSDQGCQFTCDAWIDILTLFQIRISMDGKGRWADNIYIERLWRSCKYEAVFLQSFDTVQQARAAIGEYIKFYNNERPHQALNYHTPQQVYEFGRIPTKRELFESFISPVAQLQPQRG
jgi:putative transposase